MGEKESEVLFATCNNVNCQKKFVPKRSNHLYCDPNCCINSRVTTPVNGQAKKRKEISPTCEYGKKSKNELIEELETSLAAQAILQSEVLQLKEEIARIKIAFADSLLDKLAVPIRDTTASDIGHASGVTSFSYASALKSANNKSVLVARLEQKGPSEAVNSQAIETLLDAEPGGPKVQHVSEKEDKVVMIFNNDKEREAAKRILESNPGVRSAVKTITAQKRNYPLVALFTGCDNLDGLQHELESRNNILKGNINCIRPLSKEKGHIKIYVPTKECKEAILRVGRLYAKRDGKFSSHKVVELDLNREVRRCFKCQAYGHIASVCKNANKCGKCSREHETRDCKAAPENAKCANCKGKHVSGSSTCPEQLKAVAKYRTFLDSQ